MMKNKNNTNSSVSDANQTSSNYSSTSSPINNLFLSSEESIPTQVNGRQKQRKILENLLSERADREEIEKYCIEGNLRDSRSRSAAWRILLKVLSVDCFEWPNILAQNRANYDYLKRKYSANPRRESLHELDLKVNNPLAPQQENPWQQFFADSELRECISKDVERTCPDVAFFQSQSIRQIMSDILFIYSKLVSHISYRQGMHEILAPILFVVNFDQQAHAHATEQQAADSPHSNSMDKNLLNSLNDPSYLEHDTFSIFRQLMMLIEGWYDVPLHSEQGDSDEEDEFGEAQLFQLQKVHRDAANGGKEQLKWGPGPRTIAMAMANSKKNRLILGSTPFSSSPKSMQIQEAEALTHLNLHRSPMQSELQQKLEYIHEKLLKKIDPKLFTHLTALEIAPQVYGIRWLRLLFGREFPIHDLLFLWDVILAENSEGRNGSSGLAFVDYVFVALLVQISHLLVHADYTSCIQYLMRYPPTADIHAFIKLALHLQSPKKFPRPSNIVVAHINCCPQHSSANGDSFRQVHHYHHSTHIFPHITLAGETHPNVERRQHQRKLSFSSTDLQPGPVNHYRHREWLVGQLEASTDAVSSKNADFTGGVIGHGKQQQQQMPAFKSSIENAFNKIGKKALHQARNNSPQHQPPAGSESAASLQHRRNTADSSRARKNMSSTPTIENELKEVRTKRAHTNASTADLAKSSGISSVFYYDTAEDFYKRDSFNERTADLNREPMVIEMVERSLSAKKANEVSADVELMKEQIALLQSRLNDVDMQAQLAARSIDRCCDQLKQMYAADNEDSIEKTVLNSSLDQGSKTAQKDNSKSQQLKLVVDQLQHLANQLASGQPYQQPPRERRATVPKQQKDAGLLSLFLSKENDIEVARADSLGMVELAKEAVGETPPGESVLKSLDIASSSFTPSTFSAIQRPRVSGKTELLERCFDKKKNF